MIRVYTERIRSIRTGGGASESFSKDAARKGRAFPHSTAAQPQIKRRIVLMRTLLIRGNHPVARNARHPSLKRRGVF